MGWNMPDCETGWDDVTVNPNFFITEPNIVSMNDPNSTFVWVVPIGRIGLYQFSVRARRVQRPTHWRFSVRIPRIPANSQEFP